LLIEDIQFIFPVKAIYPTYLASESEMMISKNIPTNTPEGFDAVIKCQFPRTFLLKSQFPA